MSEFTAVISRTGRAGTGSGRNQQWWRREVFHVRGENSRTLCNRDCADWFELPGASFASQDLCKRCAAKLGEQP